MDIVCTKGSAGSVDLDLHQVDWHYPQGYAYCALNCLASAVEQPSHKHNTGNKYKFV